MLAKSYQRANILVYGTILLSILLYGFVLVPRGYFAVPRLKTQDYFFRLAHAVNPLPKAMKDITLVTIDDESLSFVNQKWPWEREHYAYVVEQLLTARPKVLAFDIVFLGKSVNVKSDEMFAAALRKSGNVVLASYRAGNGAYVKPYSLFSHAATGIGLINKPRDPDSLIRSARLWMRELDSRSILDYTFETKTIGRFLDIDAKNIRINDGETIFSRPHSSDGKPAVELHVPMRKDESFLINYIARHEDFTVIPIWRVLKGQFDTRDIEGKIVLIGQANEIIHDMHPTPLGTMPGSTISANVLLTVLSNRFLREIPPMQNGLVLLFFTLLTFAISLKLDAGKGALACLLALGVYGFYSFFLFRHYLVGDFFSVPVLMPAIFIVLQIYRSLSLFIENLALKQDAITDGLTGLYVHKYLLVRLVNELDRARRYQQNLSLALLDLDFFKKFNDVYGHEEGNRALEHFSNILRDSFRKVDLLFRYGGEEFCVILHGNDAATAMESMERFRKKLESTALLVGDKNVTIQASIGLVTYPQTEVTDIHDMLKKADKALYEAKRNGRNRTCLYGV